MILLGISSECVYIKSEVPFAFCHLLGFRLLPRLKDIASQKLARPEAGNPSDYEHLQPILTKPIDWDLIKNQYDEMVKFATALRLGTAETEAILRRFTRHNLKHPTYQALAELGKAVKTIFLCRYLDAESLRQEINEGLNVVENWNSANGFIFRSYWIPGSYAPTLSRNRHSFLTLLKNKGSKEERMPKVRLLRHRQLPVPGIQQEPQLIQHHLVLLEALARGQTPEYHIRILA